MCRFALQTYVFNEGSIAFLIDTAWFIKHTDSYIVYKQVFFSVRMININCEISKIKPFVRSIHLFYVLNYIEDCLIY